MKTKKEEFIELLSSGFEKTSQNQFLIEIISYLLTEEKAKSYEFKKFMLDLTNKYIEGI